MRAAAPLILFGVFLGGTLAAVLSEQESAVWWVGLPAPSARIAGAVRGGMLAQSVD